MTRAEVVAQIAYDVYEKPLAPDEFERRLAEMRSDSGEAENIAGLIAWFCRRYPTIEARLRYAKNTRRAGCLVRAKGVQGRRFASRGNTKNFSCCNLGGPRASERQVHLVARRRDIRVVRLKWRRTEMSAFGSVAFAFSLRK